MAKKSKRRRLQYKKDQSGCMWGLINIFDFRRAGSAPQKLITDRRRGVRNVAGAGFSGGKLEMQTDSEKGQAANDRNGIMAGACSKPSVKKLIEEQMFGEVEEKNSHSKRERNVSKKTCTRTVRTRSKSDDINAIVDELYSEIQQKNAHQSEHHHLQSSSGENHLDFHEKISEATMVFITQKFICKGNLEGDEKIHHSEEFLNALETLVSNKKLLLELLEDPNSVLVKHIQTLQETMEEKDGKSKLNGEFTNRQYSFFRRKVKIPSTENSNSPNRIVILKPVSTDKDLGLAGDKNVSHFSFAEIKRKLKHAMGKERSAVPADDRSCENPSLDSGGKRADETNVGKKSPNRKFLYTEKFPNSLKNRDNAEKIKENHTGKFSNIYIEAKKHLSEMLRHGNEAGNLSSGHVPKTLGKILSFPEYNLSPIFSPHRELDHGFVTAQMRLSSKSGLLMQNPETTCFHSDGINEDKVEPRKLHPDNEDKFINDNNVEEAQSSLRENMNNEDDTGIIRTIEIEEESNVLVSEQSRSSITKDEQSGYISEECDAQGYFECATPDGLFHKESFQESHAESSRLVTPSSHPTTSGVDHVKIEIDNSDRPSPISVLDALFADDHISAATTICPPVELPIMPRRLRFEQNDSTVISQDCRSKTCLNDLELIFAYCENVLNASGILWDNLSVNQLSSSQLLDPSLFIEGVLFPNHLCHDQKLLFDCINEVLVEICEYYFGCSPFLWFVNPNILPIPNTENTIREVCEGVEWHLTPHPAPPTLEQIVQKDLVKNGKWMDLRFDAEIVGEEMSEVVFNELIEHTILSCLEANEER